MKRIVILCVLLVQLSHIISQRKIGDLELAFNPLCAVYSEPRLNLSIEKNMSKHLGFNLSMGYGNEHTSTLDMFSNEKHENYQFYEVRPELKYYFSLFTLPVYLSSEVFVLHTQETFRESSYYTSSINHSTDYERADFVKQKYGITLMGGLKPYLFRGNCYMEMFGGLGVAKRVTTFKNVIKSDYEHDYWPFFDLGQHTQGSSVVFNIVIGARLGFIVKKARKH